MDAPLRARRSLPRFALLALCLTAAAALSAAGLGLAAPPARAAGWTLVSCTNPDGTPAPTDGWAPGWWAGAPSAGSGVVDGCATGGELSAVSTGQALAFTGPELVFTAPAGDTIAGGSLTADVTAPQGQAWIGTPQPAFSSDDVLASCTTGSPCGAAGTAAGVIPISHPGGTSIYAPAVCVDFSAAACPPGAVNAQVDIKAADIELTDTAVPAATDVTGSLLLRPARGTATLRFTASDPNPGGGSGPGVDGITVLLDGVTVYSGPPNPHVAPCPSIGTDPATGHEMFDSVQPCPPTARAVIPVDTSTLADGHHTLSIVVTDAGGEAATVVSSRTITTFNPLVSPAPAAGTVATRLVVGWDGASPAVRAHSVSARRLPRAGRVSLQCLAPTGGRCPRLAPHAAAVTHARRVWTALKAASFRSGDRLRITIAAPGRPSERIQYTIRQTGLPAQRLLPAGPPLRVRSGRRRHHHHHRGSSTGRRHRPPAGHQRLASVRHPSAY
jgi:hypothetical protein